MLNDLPSEFAKTDADANERFLRFVRLDPLPDVASALFNSADIEEYVRLTGMVHPFNRDLKDNKLKSASYEADFLGELHIADATEGYQKFVIKVGESYPLPKNSISFLYLETVFRL